MDEKTELSYNEDCFAYRPGWCSALKGFYSPADKYQCRGCPFYKTREQFIKDNERCREIVKQRIARIDADSVFFIERCYDALLKGKTYYKKH